MRRGFATWMMAVAAVVVAPVAAPARAQEPPVVASARPDQVAISLYRDPSRGTDWPLPGPGEELGGFALIRETRTVELPPGPVTVRFEGVSSSILPESALLRGGGKPREKNYDRRLLSQRGLVDGFTGQQVLLRTTDPASGKPSYERVRIRSGPEQLIVERRGGFEAVQCSGLPNTLLYDAVPAGLTPVPTLSMTLGDQPGGRTKLELTYLASNFDWQSNYVGAIGDRADAVDLFAWLTVASGDSTSFTGADMAVIAGRIAFFGHPPAGDDDWEEEERRAEEAENDPWNPDNIEVWFSCWPQSSTGGGSGDPRLYGPAGWPEYALGMLGGANFGGGGCDDDVCGEIIVTGSRIAPREDIGDYKLYRVPQPTTLGAQSRKQVAFLEKPGVAARLLHVFEVRGEDFDRPDGPVLRIDNKRGGPLAEPLPGGQVALFQRRVGEPMLVAETRVKDKAVGELVDFQLEGAEDIDVDADQEELDSGEGWTRYRLTIENESESAEPVEVSFANDHYHAIDTISRATKLRDGKRIWSATVPAKGTRAIDYRVREVKRIGADNQDDWEEPEEP
ncbi:MAG: hypothetical protein JHD35_17270 [Sphingopyxis sp.]|nr:hypothetical protein [Sphingopyxis sp.]